MFPFLLQKQSLFRLFIVASSVFFSNGLQSHEIRPAIIDVMIGDQRQLDIEIALNLEALIAEIGP